LKKAAYLVDLLLQNKQKLTPHTGKDNLIELASRDIMLDPLSDMMNAGIKRLLYQQAIDLQ